MPNYTYKCPHGHTIEQRCSYEDFEPSIPCLTLEYDTMPSPVCGEEATIVFESTPFVVKAPRDTR